MPQNLDERMHRLEKTNRLLVCLLLVIGLGAGIFAAARVLDGAYPDATVVADAGAVPETKPEVKAPPPPPTEPAVPTVVEIPRRPPQPNGAPSTGNPLMDAAVGTLFSDPIFIDPDTGERLKVLYKLLLVYNHRNPANDRLDRQPRAVLTQSPRQRKTKVPMTVPTADELRTWFAALSPREKAEIDPMFNDREAHRDLVRESTERYRASGRTNFVGLMGGRPTKMFKDPLDVFTSPGDGKPFLFGLRTVTWPRDNRVHDSQVIVCEQDGEEIIAGRYIEKVRRRLCLGVTGQIQSFNRPIDDPEFPPSPPSDPRKPMRGPL